MHLQLPKIEHVNIPLGNATDCTSLIRLLTSWPA